VKVRLQKLLAAAGVASRRRAEDLIAGGDVTVNGKIARVGESADPDLDAVVVQGRLFTPPSGTHAYFAWHKPRGVVTTLKPTHGERTVVDYIHVPQRVFPVGRLDKETSGLLLLTDDGDWANFVMHPRYQVEKEYRVVVRGVPGASLLRELEQGVTLPDGTRTAPAQVRRISDDGVSATLAITVIEGKKRQIRLMLAAVGYPVVYLQRTRVGPILLDRLVEGEKRPLRAEEVDGIRERARAVTFEGR